MVKRLHDKILTIEKYKTTNKNGSYGIRIFIRILWNEVFSIFRFAQTIFEFSNELFNQVYLSLSNHLSLNTVIQVVSFLVC